MKSSEKVLMGVTGAAVALFIVFQFGGDQLLSSFTGSASGVDAQERRYNQNLQALSEIYVIERDFRAVGQPPSTGNEAIRPDLAFANEVEEIVKQAGFQMPRIRADQNAIDGVEQYRLYTTAIQLETSFNDLVKLLKLIDQSGMIIRELKLVAQNDRDQINAIIVVGRIAEAQARRTLVPTTRI